MRTARSEPPGSEGKTELKAVQEKEKRSLTSDSNTRIGVKGHS